MWDKIEKIKVFPMVVANHASYIYGYKEREVYCDGEKLAKALLFCKNFYGYDAVLVFADVTLEMEAMGGRLYFPEDSPPIIAEYPKKPKIADPKKDGRMPELLKAASIIKKSLPDIPVFVSLKGPFSLACLLTNAKDFLILLIKAEKKATDLLNLAFENQLSYLKAILEIDCIPFIGDPFASGSLIGENIFSKYALPWLQNLAKETKVSALHICGHTKNLLPHIITSGAKIISLETDVEYAKPFFPPDRILMGSVPTEILTSGTIWEVKEICEKQLLQGNKNFILSTACDVPKYAKKENVKVIVEVGHRYRKE